MEQTDRAREFDQQINITRWASLVASHRAEQGKRLNCELAAQLISMVAKNAHGIRSFQVFDV